MSMRTAEASEYLAAGDAALERARGGATSGSSNGFAESPDSISVIDQHSNFDGTFRSSRDVRVEGEVKGTIECEGTLFVAQGANVTAKIEAENITVAGDLNGDVRCRGRLRIMPSGRVRGKVSTETLVINEGAFYEGQLEMASAAERTGLTAGTPRALSAINHGPTGLTLSEPRSARTGGSPGTGAGVGTAPAGGEGGGGSPAPTNTFIRRFGGPETPWDSRQDDDDETPDPPRDS